jgi:glycosyltransferase involved in cell wall biosynthesis
VEILIVDDESPDGTGEIAARLAARHSRVQVLRRPAKLGFASAYRDGFRWAIAHGFELVGQMDADGNHAVTDIPRLLAELELNDVVGGSRWTRNGTTADWPLLRRALSRLGNAYARGLGRLPLRDATGGCRLYPCRRGRGPAAPREHGRGVLPPDRDRADPRQGPRSCARKMNDELPPQEVVVTRDLARRKSTMLRISDGFAGLLGGYGTLDELLEVISLSALGIEDRPVVLVNVDGFWAPFLTLIDDLGKRRLIPEEKKFAVVAHPAEAIDLIEGHQRLVRGIALPGIVLSRFSGEFGSRVGGHVAEEACRRAPLP